MSERKNKLALRHNKTSKPKVNYIDSAPFLTN